jgi:bisphosphoglycerate-dependent phosphoglycerate mutase
VLKADDYTFGVAYTSVLKRAVGTLWTVLYERDLLWITVHRSWRLPTGIDGGYARVAQKHFESSTNIHLPD